MRAPALALIVCLGCEPRGEELLIPLEGEEWLLLRSEGRKLVMRRDMSMYGVSGESGFEFASEAPALRLEASDGVGAVSRHADGSIYRYSGYQVFEYGLAAELELVESRAGLPALARCCIPQAAYRTLLVPGEVCPAPAAVERYDFDAASGVIRAVPERDEEAPRLWLHDRSGPSPCRAFLGTEQLLSVAAGSAPTWRRVEGVSIPPGAGDELRLAGGRESFVVVTPAAAYHVTPRPSVQTMEDHRIHGAEFVAGWLDPDGPHGFWFGVRAGGSTARGRVESFVFEAQALKYTVTATLAPDPGWPAGPSEISAWGAPGRLVVSSAEGPVSYVVADPLFAADDVQARELQLRAARTGRAQAWPSGPGVRRRASRAPGSTWIGWSSADGVGLAWLLPVLGQLDATAYALEGLPRGSLEGLVALDDDRVALVLGTGAGVSIWEWLQLPALAAHPHDQGCARSDGRSCLRPYPSSPALDGQEDCAGTTPVVHAWARPDEGVVLLLADGRSWSARRGCWPSGIEAPVRAVTAESGATLVVTRAGAVWVQE